VIVANYEMGDIFLNLMYGDGDFIWISSVTTGKVLKFDVVAGRFSQEFQGFNRPLGRE